MCCAMGGPTQRRATADDVRGALPMGVGVLAFSSKLTLGRPSAGPPDSSKGSSK